MIRIAALMIVLTLGATPVAGIVCGLNCESQAASESSPMPACHMHAGSSHGAAVGGIHVCDHDVNVGSFVMKGQESLVETAATAGVVESPSTASNNRIIASVLSASPPGISSLLNSSRLTVLRI